MTLSLCGILAMVSPPSPSSALTDAEGLKQVTGFLDAHWEYPSFLPDEDMGLEIMPFRIREETWRKVYAGPVNEGMIQGTTETVCFRIKGEGFVEPRRPTGMQPWAGSQFIFVKIQSLERLESSAKCDSRLDTDRD